MCVGEKTSTLVAPYQMIVPMSESPLLEKSIKITIKFFGNYGESPLTREILVRKDKGKEIRHVHIHDIYIILPLLY